MFLAHAASFQKTCSIILENMQHRFGKHAVIPEKALSCNS